MTAAGLVANHRSGQDWCRLKAIRLNHVLG
jgi:hypothetical protein